MNRHKLISIKLVTLLGVYFTLLLVSKLMNFDKTYQTHFVNKGNTLFSTFGDGGEVKFIKDRLSINCDIQLTSKQQKKAAIAKAKQAGKLQVAYHPIKVSINTWNHFGVLMLFWLACLIVIPISWKPKLWIALLSYGLIELYFYTKVWSKLQLEFSKWYEQFKVGWNNDFSIDLLNYFLLIISYPFFGLLFIFIVVILLSKRFVKSNLL